MNTKNIWLTCIACILQWAVWAQHTPPNVLWLDLEDLSPILSMYGDSTIETPHIDRLAREGITFTNAYATVGVCAPSRISIITGMYPAAIGGHHMRIQAPNAYAANGIPEYEVVPPPEVRCFPDLLREKGVYTICSKKTDYQFSPSPFTWDLFEKNQEEDRLSFNYPQPFFKQINFWETHESQIWDWCRQNVPLLIDSSKVNTPPYLPKTSGTRMDWITQYNNLKYTDQKIGAIMEALQTAGVLDNTIIILTGDHGNGLPRSKRTVYETGVKVPMIIRYPDMRKAKPTEELYDLLHDPFELHNLAEQVGYEAILNPMRETLNAWMVRIQDMGTTAETAIAQQFWPGGLQPLTAAPEISLRHNKIHLSCSTPGATIGFRAKGHKTWTIYTEPIAQLKGVVVEVMAHRLGFKSSQIVVQ